MVNTKHEKPKPQAAAVGAEAGFPAVWVVGVHTLRKCLLWTFRWLSASAADHWLLFRCDDFRRASVSRPHVRTVLKRTQTHNKSNSIMWQPAGNHSADYWTQLFNLYLSGPFAKATTIRSDRSHEVAVIDPALQGASAVFAWRLPSTCSHIQMSLLLLGGALKLENNFQSLWLEPGYPR